ncbi:hypothetical protein Syun_000269 [Stephania yunnanensis]|uniref:FCP1 homology domain-containing protein n=1 Tax=Stephania yunnanensis TaxID=152371 RepID=A0AAP0Q6M1_9MAGN
MVAEAEACGAAAAPKTVTVWRAVLTWLALFVQFLVQMVSVAPSITQVLSFVGFRLPLISSSTSEPESSPSFKPLPVVELPHRDSSASRSENLSGDEDDRTTDKLTCLTLNLEIRASDLGLAHHRIDGSDRLIWREKIDYPVPACRPVTYGVWVDCSERIVSENWHGKEVFEFFDGLSILCRREILCFQIKEVVLDLDETLVCAYETCSLPPIVRFQATEAGLKWFELECMSSEKDYDGKPKVNHVTVFERPGLREFLNKISEFADLVLFTAGLEGYARPLVDRIDVENRFGLRLYRPSTISTEYREHVKDLSCLLTDLNRTVIVDNNPFSFLMQPLNGIPCIPFSAGQPYDEQLLEVLLPLLKHLSLQKDVRPILYERFHMPEWFQKHGIPASKQTLK